MRTFKNFNILFSTLLFIIIIGISLEKEPIIQDDLFPSLRGCPSGTDTCDALGNICVPIAECPTKLSCPDEFLYINLYSCGLEQKFAPESQCPLNYECWDNTCITDQKSIYLSAPQ